MMQTGDKVYILQREMNPDDTSIVGVFISLGAAIAAIPERTTTKRVWQVDHDVFMWYLDAHGTFKNYIITEIPVSS
jgi:hypothetical protein